MPAIIVYLIKLSISLGVIWLFYQLLLRRLTFYNWNRWYLLGYSFLSFFIPLINIGVFVSDDTLRGSEMIRYLSLLGSGVARVDPAAASRQAVLMLVWSITQAVLVGGMLFGLIRMVARWLSLRKVRQTARLIENTGIMIYQVDKPILPFSFGNAIYINRHLHTDREWADIILHEYVHVRQRHTIDILVGELLCVVNWYNPFAWLIRHSIRQNLEFIADSKVLEEGLDKKSYQYHLLKVVGAPAYRLANNFNFSSLKKRIIMMNSIKSTRLHLVKFLFIFPLLAVLLVAFRGQHTLNDKIISNTNASSGKSIVTSGQPEQLLRLISLHKKVAGRSSGHNPAMSKDTVPVRIGSLLLMDTAKRGEGLSDPLFFVDGVPASKAILAKLNPSDIVSINVLKDEDAVKAYGEQGRKGVVQISTKGQTQTTGKSDTSQVRIMIVSPNSRDTGHSISTVVFANKDEAAKIKDELLASKDQQAKIKNEHELSSLRLRPLNQRLILLDGKEISEEEMKKLDPNKIESMNVWKGDQAVLRYGDKGKNGAVILISKKTGD